MSKNTKVAEPETVAAHAVGERWWDDPSHYHHTKWNPQSRTTPDHLKDLIASMEDRGYLMEYPILIGADSEIGDGNRRLAAARFKGIQAYFEQSNRSSREIYADNELRMKHSGADRLQAYALGGYEDFSRTYMEQLYRLEGIVGSEGIRELARRGVSPEVLKRAKAVASYVGVQTNEFINQALWWLLDLGMQRAYNEFVKLGGPPELLYNAVMKGERLRRAPVVWMTAPPAEKEESGEDERDLNLR